MIDAAAAAAKWADRTSSASAVAAYKAGIQRTTVSPGVKAAQKIDKYAQGVQDALSSGKTLQAFQSIDLGMWQNNAINFGAASIPSGVKKGTPKMQAFTNAFFPFLQQQMAANATMPDTTLQDRIAKSADMQMRLSQFRMPAQRQYS